ncbi:hypothetical protein GMOD_00006211 [Pyrenophora seminiperda CCB06]|uniref:Uncharacterized protein n=1 Tax=Pyrenophora seminiperda CCB06 TaxID=1302712 RepID=A0A3M7M4L7_9PLEO|nr:hypothetical protein GMOD_00006211 [Pyrenophora seminiperda CCB06]
MAHKVSANELVWKHPLLLLL